MRRSDELTTALAAIVSKNLTAKEVESWTLDFKEQGRSLDDFIKDIAADAICLANAKGGAIVLGVSDKGRGKSALKGCALDPDIIQRRIYELSRPGLTVDVQRELHFEIPLLVIYVPRSPEIHSDTQGRTTMRFQTDCLPVLPDQLARLRNERLGIDWSATESEVSVKKASPEAIAVIKRRLSSLPDAARRNLAKLNDPDLLRALGLVDATGKKLLNAGEVLLVNANRFSSPAFVYLYRNTTAGEPVFSDRLEGPLAVVLDRLFGLISARSNLTSLTLANGQQLQIEDFPTLAVREAISNAAIHRDYEMNEAAQVEHSPEVFAVSSPGPLVFGVTLENIITHPSKPRNPALAKAIRTIGWAEELGRGIDRMFREMVRSGRSLPQILSKHDSVRVALAGGAANTQIARFVATLPEEEQEDTDTMLVLHHMTTNRHVTADVLAPILQKTDHEAESVLRRLAQDKLAILEPTRETARLRQPRYRFRGVVLKALGSAVAYNRRTVDEIDRKVAAHISEYGTITNRTLQNLFDVSISKAQTMLADLLERGIVEKVSAHERGPGVEYGAGQRFPAKAKRKPKKK